MQADETVLSLRPGGGSRGGSSFPGSRFDSSSVANTDLPLLRPHGGAPLPSFKLRDFYSTTEEISALFAKQQEQLKSMQRTLEDEENYETTSVDFDLNPNIVNIKGSVIRNKEVEYQSNNTGKAGSSTSAHRDGKVQVESSSDEASVTEKHDCNVKSQEDGEDTQEVEFTGVERNVKGGFGSDIDGVGTTPISEENAV